MTGYGQALCAWHNNELEVQITSLNGRYFDLHLDAPLSFKKYLFTWHKLIKKHLHRGHIILALTLKTKESPPHILPAHTDALKTIFAQLKALAGELETTTDLRGGALRLFLRDAHNNASLLATSPPPDALEQAILHALERCKASRLQEGIQLKAHLTSCLRQLQEHMDEVTAYLPARKERLQQKFLERQQYLQDAEMPLREKELPPHTDKVSLEEEAIRLQSHIAYLRTTLEKGHPIGKTISFILQEAFRESNTIAAKAQDTKLQYLAIQIKDLLEQIKEQTQNIL